MNGTRESLQEKSLTERTGSQGSSLAEVARGSVPTANPEIWNQIMGSDGGDRNGNTDEMAKIPLLSKKPSSVTVRRKATGKMPNPPSLSDLHREQVSVFFCGNCLAPLDVLMPVILFYLSSISHGKTTMRSRGQVEYMI